MVTAKNTNQTYVDYTLVVDENKTPSTMPMSIALEIINRCGAEFNGDEIVVSNMIFSSEDFE